MVERGRMLRVRWRWRGSFRCDGLLTGVRRGRCGSMSADGGLTDGPRTLHLRLLSDCPLRVTCPITKVKGGCFAAFGQMRRQRLFNSLANGAFRFCRFYRRFSHKVGTGAVELDEDVCI